MISGADYHLGYSEELGQPHISVHTDPLHFEQLEEDVADLASLQARLGLDDEFRFGSDSFGFSGRGVLEDSSRVAGWTALKLAIPRPEVPGKGFATPTPDLLPVVSTLSAVLNTLGTLDPKHQGLTDSKQPQLIRTRLSNQTPLNQPYSAPLRATLSPDMLTSLDLLPDLEAAETQVCHALTNAFTYPYPYANKDDFQVNLNTAVTFSYPGDGSSFFGHKNPQMYREGMTIHAANNDYPLQQIAILGGLAALSDIALNL